jgi:hypothetical protein
MTDIRVWLRQGLVAIVLGAFVASLGLAGCGKGEDSTNNLSPEELMKRAKYRDLHPELFKSPQKGNPVQGSRKGVR